MVWIYGKYIKESDGHSGTPSCVIINSYHHTQESSAQKELGGSLLAESGAQAKLHMHLLI